MKLPPGQKKAHHKPEEAAEGGDSFAIVFAAMGVNMETAHFFKQVGRGGCMIAPCLALLCCVLYAIRPAWQHAVCVRPPRGQQPQQRR